MTLRARLLLSALLLSLATTVALALVVRSSWQKSEAMRFEQEFDETLDDLARALGEKRARVNADLAPLCQHDPIVDSALVGVRGQTLSSRLLSLRTRVPELARSLGFDELSLITHGGEVIAGDPLGRELSAAEVRDLVRALTREPSYRRSTPQAFEAACMKEEDGNWVALLGAVHVTPLLAEAARASDLRLSLHDADEELAAPETESYVKAQTLFGLDGAILRAERSRRSLRANLRHLDSEVLSAAGGTLLGALLLAFFLSRGLARPVTQFAERTRLAVRGQVQQLPISGGPELEQAARAFNATLNDLAALRERLQVTERIAARREVARRIAHEIKNPLSPIRTSIETLRKMKERNLPEFDDYFHETTQTVLQEVRRISTMVSHFAEYARLPSPSTKPTDLAALCKDIVRLHGDLGVRVTVEGPETLTATVDTDQISQVLTNLLKNAIESLAGSPDGHVHLSLAESSDETFIVVDDNGAGLPQEQVDKIFEPYFTTKKDGSGLGLPISHRIAVEHGGDLTYTTSPRGGARFTLRLPRNGPPTLAETDPSRG